ncbi:MAG: hypothetical protein ACTSUC_09755 [Promethearchaeota archaeon]
MTSKTKIGATLVGAGLLIGAIGEYLQGSMPLDVLITTGITIIGGVLAVFGIRDMPIINNR